MWRVFCGTSTSKSLSYFFLDAIYVVRNSSYTGSISHLLSSLLGTGYDWCNTVVPSHGPIIHVDDSTINKPEKFFVGKRLGHDRWMHWASFVETRDVEGGIEELNSGIIKQYKGFGYNVALRGVQSQGTLKTESRIDTLKLWSSLGICWHYKSMKGKSLVTLTSTSASYEQIVGP